MQAMDESRDGFPLFFMCSLPPVGLQRSSPFLRLDVLKKVIPEVEVWVFGGKYEAQCNQ